MSEVWLPDWWTYPTCCSRGHQWGPGRVIVSWRPCHCGPARAVMPTGSGHRTISCRVQGCGAVHYDPPHDPAFEPAKPGWRG